ncbi:RHS repeat protein [Methyloversatilis sp.]|uniref:RHS repeat protein n=1 Tax=Methyloversatilis sp. TaxID=2569862 RepID=UPI0027347C34|nr:RHS repeat protein [Methyloversatilis sp.]
MQRNPDYTQVDYPYDGAVSRRDQAGNAWQVTNRLNEVTHATFDLLNRPTRIDYLKDGSSETFAYDAAGKLASAANGTLAYTFEYDALNRLTEKLDSRGRSLAFSYDAAGNLLTKTTYQGSTTLSRPTVQKPIVTSP